MNRLTPVPEWVARGNAGVYQMMDWVVHNRMQPIQRELGCQVTRPNSI